MPTSSGGVAIAIDIAAPPAPLQEMGDPNGPYIFGGVLLMKKFGAAKAGYLCHYSTERKEWKWMYMVLRDDELLCFRNFEDSLPYCHAMQMQASLDKTIAPLVTIALPPARSCSDLQEGEVQNQRTFSFQMVDGNLKPVLVLAAQGDKEKEEWMETLDQMWANTHKKQEGMGEGVMYVKQGPSPTKR